MSDSVTPMPLVPAADQVEALLKKLGITRFVFLFSDPDDNYYRSRFGVDKVWVLGALTDTLAAVNYQRHVENVKEYGEASNG